MKGNQILYVNSNSFLQASVFAVSSNKLPNTNRTETINYDYQVW